MLKAIFFDMDGVIVDTERDGHRVAFNETFEEFGLADRWDVELYHRLLQIAGGKERMQHYFTTMAAKLPVPIERLNQFVGELHARKTSRLIEMIEQRRLPLRPGIRRFMIEARDDGLAMVVCTTSNERFARAVLRTLLSDIPFAAILAGDVVENKKPNPAIYELALNRTAAHPCQCLVVEDSANGVQAAAAAGIPILATTNDYTENEDLFPADIVVTSLGDSSGPRAFIRKPSSGFAADGVVHLQEVKEYLYDD